MQDLYARLLMSLKEANKAIAELLVTLRQRNKNHGGSIATGIWRTFLPEDIQTALADSEGNEAEREAANPGGNLTGQPPLSAYLVTLARQGAYR